MLTMMSKIIYYDERLPDQNIIFPDYDPPQYDLGKKNTYNLPLNRYLSIYKKIHNCITCLSWIYCYVCDLNGRHIATVIYDRFPKSMLHLLVIPNFTNKLLPTDLSYDDLKFVKIIHKFTYKLCKFLKFKYDYIINDFIMGYHANPSMHDIHLHLLSDDLNSPFMKCIEHFNSFTNMDCFITPERLENDLKICGKLNINKSMCDLKCHKCGDLFDSIECLKNHVSCRYKCHKCGRTFESLKCFKNHNNNSVIYGICNKNF